MFNSKEYMFLICQDQVLNDNPEKDLKSQIFEYVNENLKTFFGKKKIEYTDFYTSKTNNNIYTLMTTCKPTNKNKLFVAFLYEVYAFAQTDDETIFESYEYERKDFANEHQTIKVYKFKF